MEVRLHNKKRNRLQHSLPDSFSIDIGLYFGKVRHISHNVSVYLMSLTRFNINLNIKKSQRYGLSDGRSEPDTMCYTPRRIISLLLDIEMMRRVQRGAKRSGASFTKNSYLIKRVLLRFFG